MGLERTSGHAGRSTLRQRLELRAAELRDLARECPPFAFFVVVLHGRFQRLAESQTRALQRERESRAHLDAIFAHAPATVSFLDRDLRYVRVNDNFAELCGLEPEQILGRSVQDVWPERTAEMVPALRHVLETGEPTAERELTVEAPPGSGTIRHLLISRYPVPAPDGEILGVASIAVDVTRLKHVEAQLEELLTLEQSARLAAEAAREDLAAQAATDALTGLANRIGFWDHAAVALARARRNEVAVAALYLDLDDFKPVNDTLGHAAGDDLLRVVAGRLRAAARETDVVARFGGDEFVVLLADLPEHEAASIAERVATRVIGEIAKPIVLPDGEARVSASVGVSLYPADAEDADILVAHADIAMYESKRRGPGQARFFRDAQGQVA